MAMPDTDRKEVFSSIRAALRAAFNADRPSPVWWIRFRVTGAGSGGSHGGALSILGNRIGNVFDLRGAAQTIDRLIDGFAASDKEMVRTMLSESLLAVVA